ncbi:hypothetical protein INR49_029127 [Caranx melampygus]|nr:hypothetical protein INR49_029127 [Caranx melampygus]
MVEWKRAMSTEQVGSISHSGRKPVSIQFDDYGGVGVSALSPRYPRPMRRYCQDPQNDTETATAASVEGRVISAVQHTNTLVRLLKRSSHNK